MAIIADFNREAIEAIKALDPEQLAWATLLDGLRLSTHEAELVSVLLAAKRHREQLPICALNEIPFKDASALRDLARQTLARLNPDRDEAAIDAAAEALCIGEDGQDAPLHKQHPRVQAALRRHADLIVDAYHQSLERGDSR